MLGRVCPFTPFPSLGEKDVSAMDPGAGSGQLPGDICQCWIFLQLLLAFLEVDEL